MILRYTDLDAVTLSAASMIGLALGVDYSLLIVTRFREGLADGHAPKQAASIAANTAGRTANFAGLVLLAITIVAFFLSPGTILLSMALGMIVVTVLSMIGAIVVTPAAVSLLGHRVNMWQIGGAPSEGGGAISADRQPRDAAVRRWRPGCSRRCWRWSPRRSWRSRRRPPTRASCPKDSDGLAAFYALRKAGFGPEIDVALVAPKGTLLAPARLAQIQRLERQLATGRARQGRHRPGADRRPDHGAAPRAEADPQVQAPAAGRPTPS